MDITIITKGINMSGEIWDHFSVIRDPRIERAQKHNLQDILVITICSVICGADHWTHIEEFGKSNEEWFREFLELPHGIPSHDTFGRFFSALSPNLFEEAFQSWIKDVCGGTKNKQIAIDGKSIRKSFTRASKKNAIHMVSAWVCENETVFGQIKVDEKSNEITAVPKLLEMLDLEGAIVTIDAMGCQKKIAKKIVDGQGDYVLSLKGNQGNLHDDVKDYLDDAIVNSKADDIYESVEKNHGRIEERKVWVVRDVDWIHRRHEGWSGLNSIVAVQSRRTIDGQTSKECRYFISSSKNKSAQELGAAIRNHWQVENNLHWSLDVSFREDDCRVRIENAAENFSRVRRIALSLIKLEKTAKVGVKGKRLKAGWNKEYLLKILQI
jgi:predicted transposase YbfD/YdcC